MLRLRLMRSIVPLLAVLFALAGVAGARAGAERVNAPSLYALCLGGETTDGGHDCLDCCLPPLAAPLPSVAAPVLWSSPGAVLEPEGTDFGLKGFGLARPVSRGPPVRA